MAFPSPATWRSTNPGRWSFFPLLVFYYPSIIYPKTHALSPKVLRNVFLEPVYKFQKAKLCLLFCVIIVAFVIVSF